jgi:hypothetical protein
MEKTGTGEDMSFKASNGGSFSKNRNMCLELLKTSSTVTAPTNEANTRFVIIRGIAAVVPQVVFVLAFVLVITLQQLCDRKCCNNDQYDMLVRGILQGSFWHSHSCLRPSTQKPKPNEAWPRRGDRLLSLVQKYLRVGAQISKLLTCFGSCYSLCRVDLAK